MSPLEVLRQQPLWFNAILAGVVLGGVVLAVDAFRNLGKGE